MNRKKRFISFALVLCFSLAVYSAQLYRSNSIGQMLQEIGEGERDGFPYVLEVSRPEPSKERRVLYHDQQVVGITDITIADGNKVRTIVKSYDYDSQGNEISSTCRTYERGLLNSEAQTIGDFSSLSLYTYEEDRLIERKDVEQGNLVRITTYYRADDGMLCGLRVIEATKDKPTISYFSKEEGTLVYGEGTDESFLKTSFVGTAFLLNQVSNEDGQTTGDEAYYDEAGRLVIVETKENERVYKTYGPDGLLVREDWQDIETPTRTITYEYDAYGDLYHTVELLYGDQVKRIERWYTQGELESVTEWVDEVPVKSVRYLSDGTSVVTLFDNGRPYADVTYASDGKRVLSLEYRKEQ